MAGRSLVLPVDAHGHAADAALSDVEVDVGDDDGNDDDSDGGSGPTSAGGAGAAPSPPQPPRPLSAMHSPSVSSVFAANDRNARNAAGDRVSAQKRVTVARMSKRELAMVLKLRARQLRYAHDP